ncbi:hypothetical protein [Bdellovibrio sp. NC01]|uniref:hypothetical protein n=1 Tax=Bdellovibrio sp. NC01 TaxID=2220073 RepID=UPI0011583FB5|nr:hypothetical protein [Bdellovibrio sp. NC01]QDK38981.1 hypothetical protein DOE51_15995 [Bdellovibrio sp. NC01]
MFSTTKVKTLILAATAMMGLAACSPGSTQVIKGADLKAEAQSNGDIYINLTTHLDSNNVQILAAQLPIMNPNNPAEQLGLININTSAPGITDIALGLNLSAVAKLPVLTPETTLPNGTSFPVWNTTAKWYSLPLNNSKTSKLYVNIDWTAQKSIVGYALTSDSLSAGIVANIFSVFNANGVTGYGGVFSGTTPGTSGLAVFADVSSVLTALNPTFSPVVTKKIVFADHTSEVKQKMFTKKLIDLNVKKAKIKFK